MNESRFAQKEFKNDLLWPLIPLLRISFYELSVSTHNTYNQKD